MTQQPQVRLTLADIAQALMQGVVSEQTTYTYFASVLKENGGKIKVTTETLEQLKNSEDWTITLNPAGDNAVEFRLLEGAEKTNAALGRTPEGIIVP